MDVAECTYECMYPLDESGGLLITFAADYFFSLVLILIVDVMY